MNTITYDPNKDSLILQFLQIEDEPSEMTGPFRLWVDDEGSIQALAITNYTEVSKEFRKNLETAQLQGIWKGVKITDRDIRDARQDLLGSLEEKW
jgi:hypothetical protein